MRAYRLSNDDVVIDVRPYVSSNCSGSKQLLKCLKVWCHKREDYCFKVIVTDRPITKRLNSAETTVVYNQLGRAILKGTGQQIPEEPKEPKEDSWYEWLKDAMPATVKEVLP